jgi:hypothetical protein
MSVFGLAPGIWVEMKFQTMSGHRAASEARIFPDNFAVSAILGCRCGGGQLASLL